MIGALLRYPAIRYDAVTRARARLETPSLRPTAPEVAARLVARLADERAS